MFADLNHLPNTDTKRFQYRYCTRTSNKYLEIRGQIAMTTTKLFAIVGDRTKKRQLIERRWLIKLQITSRVKFTSYIVHLLGSAHAAFALNLRTSQRHADR